MFQTWNVMRSGKHLLEERNLIYYNLFPENCVLNCNEGKFKFSINDLSETSSKHFFFVLKNGRKHCHWQNMGREKSGFDCLTH